MRIMGNAAAILDQLELDDKENFSQVTIDRFKSDPEFYKMFVKGIEKEVNNAFPMVCEPPVSYRESPATQLTLLRNQGAQGWPSSSICTSQGHRIHDCYVGRKRKAVQGSHSNLSARSKKNDSGSWVSQGSDAEQC